MKKRGGGREDLKGGVPSLFRPSLSLHSQLNTNKYKETRANREMGGG